MRTTYNYIINNYYDTIGHAVCKLNWNSGKCDWDEYVVYKKNKKVYKSGPVPKFPYDDLSRVTTEYSLVPLEADNLDDAIKELEQKLQEPKPKYDFYYHDEKIFSKDMYLRGVYDLDGKWLENGRENDAWCDKYDTWDYQYVGKMTLNEAVNEIKNNRKHYGNYLFNYQKGGYIIKYIQEYYTLTHKEWVVIDDIFEGYQDVERPYRETHFFRYDLNGNLLGNGQTNIREEYTEIGWFNTLEEALNKVNEMGIEYYEKLEYERIERLYPEDDEDPPIPFT